MVPFPELDMLESELKPPHQKNERPFWHDSTRRGVVELERDFGTT